MKQLMSLIAIAIISTTSFAASQTAAESATTSALSAAWKHQNPMTIGSHNLTMVYGGQDISTKSMLEGPTASA